MRHLIIDTETTGLDPRQGHRIIEIAALELVDRQPTGRTLHLTIDPEREVDAGATQVHGMTWDDLRGKPKFRDVAAEFVAFAQGAEWIIHNAPFDVGFLDAELARHDHPPCAAIAGRIVDTLAMARETFPGKRNNLDALCERFGVDNTRRTRHGALLDAELLSEVWLGLTRGQEALAIDATPARPQRTSEAREATAPSDRPALLVSVLTAEEHAQHAAYLARLDADSKGRCLWLALDRMQVEPAAA
jgi:DNA polymerase-3 subunit epsilon